MLMLSLKVANETMDSDADAVGDNADAFPNDATEWLDTDVMELR